MPASFKDKNLKKFGKHRREVRISQSNEHGGWQPAQHHAQMRQLRNALFENYYGRLQRLGESSAVRFLADKRYHQESLHQATTNSSDSIGYGINTVVHGLKVEEGECSSTALERWNEEMTLFRTPLPITFWINDTDPLASEVRDYLKSLDPAMLEPIPWYPIKNMAWRVLADKEAFRKQPNMQALRRYMIRQTALGTISRQEEVSMIPPFLLDIQPTDLCLDMCASPGSKTAQMLVALGRHKVVPWGTNAASPFPFDYASEGLIVANELDTKRANMLVHQVKRMQLLFPFALFTNHDARYFPDITLVDKLWNRADAGDNLPTEGTENVRCILRFDKILCDVVCSGDGTLRKAPHIFKVWSPREAMSLQRIQIRIALRGCHLLKVGGRLVYSTCSLNPIENEAVVAQIIHQTNGSMKLVDARSLLPELHCAPGLCTWSVTDAKGNVVDHPSESMHVALFPPNTSGGYHSAAVDEIDLSLCMRFLPSHCNGGGFFIAVLDKVKEFRLEKMKSVAEEDSPSLSEGCLHAKDEEATPVTAPDAQASRMAHNMPLTENPSSKRGCGEDGEEEVASSLSGSAVKEKIKRIPPQFVQPIEAIHDTLVNFYKIDKFPEDLLIMRAPHGEWKARATTSCMCSIVSQTTRRVLAYKTDSLIVVSAGLRVFSFETLDKGWRIASEAAPLFGKLMTESPRLLKVPLDFVKSMIYLGGKMKELPLETIENVALREQLEGLPLGALLLEIDCPGTPNEVFFSVALRARTKIQLLVGHEDLPGLELRLGLEPRAEVCELMTA